MHDLETAISQFNLCGNVFPLPLISKPILLNVSRSSRALARHKKRLELWALASRAIARLNEPWSGFACSQAGRRTCHAPDTITPAQREIQLHILRTLKRLRGARRSQMGGGDRSACIEYAWQNGRV